MNILQYIPIIVSIRNNEYFHFKDQNTIENTNLQDVHKRLLIKLHNDNYPVALVFNNELLIDREIGKQYGSIDNNEIKNFILNNNTWDIIIISKLTNPNYSDIDGYTYMKKLNDNTTFHYNSVYIASARFFNKVFNNNFVDIQNYYYTVPFLNNIESIIQNPYYTVGYITNIDSLQPFDIKYNWTEMHV